MKKFEVVRMPLLDHTGNWISSPTQTWPVIFDGRSGSLTVFVDGLANVLDWRSLVAVQISDEKEVTNVRGTIGRIALTGIGVSLFSRGRNGGLGAGLLDLSMRGAEKKSIVSGFMSFRDSTLLAFNLIAADFENMTRFTPPHVYGDEALEQAGQFYHLIERMSLDGRRGLDELAGELEQAHAEGLRLNDQIEHGSTFAERDEARTNAQLVQYQVEAKRYLLVALLHGLGITPRDFMTSMAHRPALKALIVVPERPTQAAPSSAGSNSAQSLPPEEPRIQRTPPAQRLKAFAIAAGFVVLALWLLYQCSK